MSSNKLISTQPLGYFGAHVTEIDLSGPLNEKVVQALKDEVTRKQVLVFRGNDRLTPERHIEICQWFGEVDDSLQKANFFHPRSPDSAILRLSNDKAEGHRGFGSRGFHVDGSFLEKPNSHAVYHMVRASRHSTTLFADMVGVLKHISSKKFDLWNRLYMTRSDGMTGTVTHPLVYAHPLTHKPTLCLHLGNVSYFSEATCPDPAPGDLRPLSLAESQEVAQDIETEFHRDSGLFMYTHQWQTGDVLLTDNLSVAHLAGPTTQQRPERVGLRVLHRVVTCGVTAPRKAGPGPDWTPH